MAKVKKTKPDKKEKRKEEDSPNSSKDSKIKIIRELPLEKEVKEVDSENGEFTEEGNVRVRRVSPTLEAIEDAPRQVSIEQEIQNTRNLPERTEGYVPRARNQAEYSPLIRQENNPQLITEAPIRIANQNSGENLSLEKKHSIDGEERNEIKYYQEQKKKKYPWEA